MPDPTICFLFILITITTISLVITITNLGQLQSISDSHNYDSKKHTGALVSVLIPARNEEANISTCLESIIGQDYDLLEIIILDDCSTDQTSNIVNSFSNKDPRIQAVSGTEPPSGWLGKHWACDQLQAAANGQLLLFIDADTVLSANAISASVNRIRNREVDLLTAMPRRISGCLVEQFLYMFIDWSIFCWLPLKLAHESKNPRLSATFGQFMLFKREAYDAIGGHSKIRKHPCDDFTLGRSIKKEGLSWMLADGTSYVTVLPYKGNWDAFTGVSRSIYPALDFRLGTITILALLLVFFGFYSMALFIDGIQNIAQSLSRFCIFVLPLSSLVTTWIIVFIKFKHRNIIALFYPAAIALIIAAGYHSVVTYSYRVTSWKQRNIYGPKTRI